VRARLKSALDLGLIWAWAPENSLRDPIGRARALIDTGISRRLESNRPRFPSLWCRVRVGTPGSADPAQPGWHSTGSCPSSQSASRRVAKRTGRCCCASKARARGTARTWTLARTSAIRSGVESPKPIHALLALQRVGEATPRRVVQRPGGRARDPATRLRQCVAAEQLRGDDGARLRLLRPQRSGREVGARRDACSSSSASVLRDGPNNLATRPQASALESSKSGTLPRPGAEGDGRSPPRQAG
jgi:hypothetical protein